jgi:lipid II:glycine glycyltransferase (peptidoglycan interpeptide bridge formation enzyme)
MINHHIPVDAQLLHEKMHRMEQKRLRKCRRAGFVFRQEPIAQLPEHFTFLQNCRQEKGWQLSMTLDEIKEMTHAFPQTYRLFSVYDGGRRVAASLSVLIRSDLLYDFYHDSPGEYRSFSPVTLLLQSMYAYCREQGIRLLDMGTSPAVSLQQFKAHMGGVGSQKKSYYLRLND